jgi:sialate O-acetylesterase
MLFSTALRSPSRTTRANVFATLLALVATSAAAWTADDPRPFLHPLFVPQAVLQQGKPIPIWGWTTPGAKVAVTIGGQNLNAVAGPDGKWLVKTTPFKVGDGPLTLTVSGPQQATVADLRIGEVWLCAGQSNMFWFMNAVKDSEKEIAVANFPQISLFSMLEDSSAVPRTTPNAVVHHWASCIPGLVGNFSAVGFYFGRELFQHLDEPIGLINVSYGGTTCEAWMSEDAVRKEGDFGPQLSALSASRAEMVAAGDKFNYDTLPVLHGPRNAPTLAYNGMFAPLAGFPVAGVLWYQGESNSGDAKMYRKLLPGLIADWRRQQEDPNLPFVIIQLAGHFKPHADPFTDDVHTEDADWTRVMEVQADIAKIVPHCGLACAYDQGSVEEIHPTVKSEVGRRAGYAALNLVYGKKDLMPCGPTVKAIQRDGESLIIHYANIGKGLVVKGDGGVTTFAVADEGGALAWATAKVDKDIVTLTCPTAHHPVKVQFAYDCNPPGQLYNSDGEPAVPFRMDVK